MSKTYKKERLGLAQGSIVSPRFFPMPHSPEEEENIQKLVESLRPYLLQKLEDKVNLFIQEQFDINEGDFIQYIINYITNYFNTYVVGQTLKAGNGIKISKDTISVRDGEGLEADDGDLNIDLADDPGLQITSEKLEAKCNTSAAIDKDSDGLKVVLSDTLLTGEGGTGGGLSFDSTDGVRVAPEDFLKTE